MTIIANIVERFTMQLEEPAPGHEEWFLDWVLRSPKNAGHHLTAGWLTLCDLATGPFIEDEIKTSREYFAGMGAQALMVEELFHPVRGMHDVMDYSTEAVEHMRRALPEYVGVWQGDSYEPIKSQPSDLVMLDFGDLTVWKTREGEKHRQLLDRVFALEPRAVVLTDIACRYLHLHRERYETLLGAGSCRTYETYLMALCDRLRELYGYELYSGYWDRWSAVMSFVPVGTSDFVKLAPTPDSPVGLELL